MLELVAGIKTECYSDVSLCIRTHDNDYDMIMIILLKTFKTLHICFPYNYKKIHTKYWCYKNFTEHALIEFWMKYTYHELNSQ